MNKFYALVILIFSITFTAIGQVSINTDNTPPDQSAMLDVKSSTKGILAPRVALTAINVASPISNPAIGLLVYNTIAAGAAPDNVVPGYYRWNGAKWILIEAPQGSSTGDMQYWNGTQWVIVPAGTYGQQLFFCNGIPTWGGCPPVLTTAPVINITYNSAVSGGDITLDGGSAIVSRGVCWSTTPNPTINDNKTIDGSGTGSFVSNITGLSPNTTYYVRSYATNSNLTGYGNDTSFTTLCEFYPTVNVSIEASTNPVCEGSIVSLQATPTNGGLLPVYQWKVNGVSVGTNNSVLMYTPANHDTVQCIMTSSLPCTSTPAVSNTIIITVNPMLAVGVTIAASANNVCQGDTVTFTATGVNAGTITNYQWKLGGNIISAATSSTYSYVPANNDVITCLFTSNPPCTLNNSATSNSITMTVVSSPDAPTSGTHIPAQSQINWNWNPVVGATGYKWNTTNDYISAIDMGTTTTKTETGLTCDSAYSRFVWAYNSCGNSTSVILTQSTSPCSGSGFTCGQTLTINHVAGAVAPVNKTTTYGTVANIPGEPNKCWITSNLGSDHQATSVNDATEASAGWYWQFNRKQGFKAYNSTVTPSWTITSINDNSDWLITNDPCSIELGIQWRIPNYTEWYNVDNAGTWTNWNDPWSSALKVHAAGYIFLNGGLDIRGSVGYYYSSTQYNSTTGWFLYFNDSQSSVYNWPDSKADGMSLRCIRESCNSVLSSPTPGTNSAITTQINWNWNTVTGATGYKWNTIDNFGTATDMGPDTTKTETGLTCNIAYTRYVWAYNSCGNSPSIILVQSTSPCSGSSFTCGQNITINHLAGAVAPVNKTTIYGTVTNIPGEPNKCWITSNLGSDHQATAVNDATETSAGWYWQFNRKQGYKHDGSVPSPTWPNNSIQENSNWESSNDPCNISLGDSWRIPTMTEWYNVDLAGAWNNWNGTWSSPLKIHAAGAIESGTPQGALVFRGAGGQYWSSSHYTLGSGWVFAINSGTSYVGDNAKTNGYSIRCIRDCNLPLSPTQGSHTPSTNQIIWNWNSVAGAIGYKWNITNDYGTAIDMGTATTKTETGLSCNTAYTRYVWAYNSCGNSTAVALTQSTSACGAPCPGTPTVTYGDQTYNTVQIGSQCWFKENLDIGTMIVGTLSQTNNGVIEKYCYNNDNSNCTIYGGLYQWNEVMQYLTTTGNQGICPSGWHIPTDTEWCTLTEFLYPTGNCLGTNYNNYAGGKMKATGTIQAGTGLWNSPNGGASNESGFSSVPAGDRYTSGTFEALGSMSLWWSSSVHSYSYASWARSNVYGGTDVGRGANIISYGFSIRCLRDF